jgi:hypothetical protein
MRSALGGLTLMICRGAAAETKAGERRREQRSARTEYLRMYS